MSILTIPTIISSEDPLSAEAIEFLFNFKEENEHVDYKLTFSFKEDREWLNITKDFLSFSNTNSGFLIFGIQNGTYKKVGLDLEIASYLSEPNIIIQKINRYISPQINHFRVKKIQESNNYYVFIFIPASKNCTHIVEKRGAYKNENGQEINVLSPGEIYIRKSGVNSLIDRHAFEELLTKRIDFFKESFLNKISRVIEAPPEHEILVFDPQTEDVDNGNARRFRITSAPDAIPVVGLSFTISPRTDEELISSWIALGKNNPKFKPPKNDMFRIYCNRHKLTLSIEQKEFFILFSLMHDAPVFFWLKGMKKENIIKLLEKAFSLISEFQNRISILHISTVLGKTEFNSILKLFTTLENSHLYTSKTFPINGPKEFFRLRIIDKQKSLEEQATFLAEKIANDLDVFPEKETLLGIDFELYAQKNGY